MACRAFVIRLLSITVSTLLSGTVRYFESTMYKNPAALRWAPTLTEKDI